MYHQAKGMLPRHHKTLLPTLALEAFAAVSKGLLRALGRPCKGFAPFLGLEMLVLASRTVPPLLLLLPLVADTPAGSFALGCTVLVSAYSPAQHHKTNHELSSSMRSDCECASVNS